MQLSLTMNDVQVQVKLKKLSIFTGNNNYIVSTYLAYLANKLYNARRMYGDVVDDHFYILEPQNRRVLVKLDEVGKGIPIYGYKVYNFDIHTPVSNKNTYYMLMYPELLLAEDLNKLIQQDIPQLINSGINVIVFTRSIVDCDIMIELLNIIDDTNLTYKSLD